VACNRVPTHAVWDAVRVGVPSGTVTFLFTDIEGSTGLWEAAPEAMRAALVRHDELVRGAIEAHDGYVFATGGDGFGAAFARAHGALAAAGDAQTALSAERWPDGTVLRVRMGLHTGEVDERGGDYFGPAVNRAARIMAAGHGGQVLVSATTAGVAGAAGLIDLGEHTFAGLEAPERVYQAGNGGFPPLRSVGVIPSNLPAERSVFVGRERELGIVSGLVRSARVVTLTGVGGVGKTRLAIQAAAGLAPEFPDGVWLAELAPLIDSALVPSALASAVGASVAGGLEATDAVCRFLGQRRALVVLDNCEHVIAAVAALVDRLLGAAPRVRVLATSREALDVAGESTWRVPSLSLDADSGEGDALALFAERASQVQPGFSLAHPGTHEAAVAVCQRLDGIPLAIELAAARAKVMSVDQIAAHLDERFRLLTRGGRTAVPRQQTLRGAIDWSYDLLIAPERWLFDTLGIFAGEFDLAAVAAVCGLDEFEALDVIEQLVAKSMVEADPSRDRYRLLETLRQYAWDRLIADGRLAEVRDAHAACFAALAGAQARRMGEGGEQVAALDRLEADYDNLRAALAWLIEQRRADEAGRMAGRLIGLFNIRHPREGFAWFRQVAAIAGDLPVRSRTRVLGDAAYAAMNAGNLDDMVSYARNAIEVGGDDAPAIAHWLLGFRDLGGTSPDYAAASGHCRRAITAAAATGDVTTQALAVSGLAGALAFLGEVDEARRLIDVAIERAERLGNPTILAAVYQMAAEALARNGAPQDALVMFERGLVHADAGGPLVATTNRIHYALSIDDPHEAARIFQAVIPIAREHLAGFHQSVPLLVAAKIAAGCGSERTAARLLGAFTHHRGWSGSPGDHWEYERLVSQLKSLLGIATFEDELCLGAQLSIGQALQLADDIVATV
jgi:predicted ATPase/class 3 adenylate cyclase